MVHLHKNFFWTLWSLALAEKSCKNIKNRRAQVSRLCYFLWLWFYFTILACSRCQFCKWYKYRYWKEGKKGPHFCTRLYDLFLKVYFSESWFLVLFQFMKTWKTRQKCFFPSRGKHVFSLKLLSRLPLKGFFIERIKKIWSILWTLSKEKSKQVFIMASFHFQNQTNLNKI